MALVDRGADVDARDEDQMTPLHWACINGSLRIMKINHKIHYFDIL